MSLRSSTSARWPGQPADRRFGRAHVRWGQNSPNRNPLREGGAIARRQVGPVVTRGATARCLTLAVPDPRRRRWPRTMAAHQPAPPCRTARGRFGCAMQIIRLWCARRAVQERGLRGRPAQESVLRPARCLPGQGGHRCRRPGLPRAVRDRLAPSLRGWCRSRRGRLRQAGLACLHR